jgi:hypothetical protein
MKNRTQIKISKDTTLVIDLATQEEERTVVKIVQENSVIVLNEVETEKLIKELLQIFSE